MQFAAAQLLWYVLSFLKVEGFKGEKNRTFVVQIKSTKTKCFIFFILHCTYMITMGKNIQD